MYGLNFWRSFWTSAPNRLRATPRPNMEPEIGSDRIFGSVRFGSAIRLISAGSVRFGFGSDYPNINRTSRARMSISNAPRVAKKN